MCVNCAIANCVSCTGDNVCSSCGNGYTLMNNTCVCPLSMNISQVTQKCVTCSVSNCYKCSSDDVCEVFSPLVSSPSNATNITGNSTLNGTNTTNTTNITGNNILNGNSLLTSA